MSFYQSHITSVIHISVNSWPIRPFNTPFSFPHNEGSDANIRSIAASRLDAISLTVHTVVRQPPGKMEESPRARRIVKPEREICAKLSLRLATSCFANVYCESTHFASIMHGDCVPLPLVLACWKAVD